MQHTINDDRFSVCETGLNMQRMANIENLLTLEQQSTTIKHAIVRTTLEKHVVAYTPCWSYVDPTFAEIYITTRGGSRIWCSGGGNSARGLRTA